MGDLMQTPATMSSLEIADLTGKRHDHVMRDIRNMLAELNAPNSGGVDFSGVYTDAKGEKRACFNLARRECLILVSGYSIVLRARIIDRWEELERQPVVSEQPVLDGLNDPAILRHLLLIVVERNLAVQRGESLASVSTHRPPIAPNPERLVLRFMRKHRRLTRSELTRCLHGKISPIETDAAVATLEARGLISMVVEPIPSGGKPRTEYRIVTPRGMN